VTGGELLHGMELLLGGLEGGFQPRDLSEPALAAGLDDAASRFSRISVSLGSWAGSGLSCGHLTQLCSWAHGVPKSRVQTPRATLRSSKWCRN
jgi:hypothetical protein